MNMTKYLNDFHKKNSEAAMEYLRKQRVFSQEEMEAQTRKIHEQIAQEEQNSKKNK